MTKCDKEKICPLGITGNDQYISVHYVYADFIALTLFPVVNCSASRLKTILNETSKPPLNKTHFLI